MTLIKSISGIRGTIGGDIGNNLTPVDIVECTAGFCQWIKNRKATPIVVVGRDGRVSGSMVMSLVIDTIISMGLDVIDLGLSTTPTVEMAVKQQGAGAGIVITASHNPIEWNALKFLNKKGEFISAEDGRNILQYIADRALDFADIHSLGKKRSYSAAIDDHITAILAHEWVDVSAIKEAKFSVVVDCINSTGALAIPPLLDALGVGYKLINEDVTGVFAHNPEPLASHLTHLCAEVKDLKANMGISVDPDVDRLAFVSEDGSMFGEEYTLVAIADYILGKKSGHAVSNMSSSRALRDIAIRHGGSYSAAPVGEVNVVEEMKRTNALIGGEGNGGVIVPDLHYGRDAVMGIALFLSYVAQKKAQLSSIKHTLPQYEMLKDKIPLQDASHASTTLDKIAVHYANESVDRRDGVKIDFEDGWVHIRSSNTEPIIRIYAEAHSIENAQNLISNVKSLL